LVVTFFFLFGLGVLIESCGLARWCNDFLVPSFSRFFAGVHRFGRVPGPALVNCLFPPLFRTTPSFFLSSLIRGFSLQTTPSLFWAQLVVGWTKREVRFSGAPICPDPLFSHTNGVLRAFFSFLVQLSILPNGPSPPPFLFRSGVVVDPFVSVIAGASTSQSSKRVLRHFPPKGPQEQRLSAAPVHD